MWAYIIGSVCAVTATLDIKKIEHQQLYDQINNMLVDLAITRPLASSVRSFLFQTEEMERRIGYSALIDTLSPELQGQLSEEISAKRMAAVKYFSHRSAKFRLYIFKRLDRRLYCPQELVHETALLIIANQGVVGAQGCIYTSGMALNLDFFLKRYRVTVTMRALNYVEFEILTLADLNAVLDLCPADRMPIKWVRIFFAMIRKVRSDAREAELAKSGGKLKSSATFGAIISDEITHAHAVADHYSKGMSHDKISQRLASERATNRTTVLDLPSDAGRGTQKGGDGGGEKRAPRVIAVRPNSASGLRPDFGAASSMPSSRQVAPILECPAADAGSRAPRRHSNVVTPGHPPRRTSNVVAFGRKSIRLPEMGARDAYSDDRATPRDARPRGDSPPPRRTNWSTVNRERTVARKLWRALA